MTMRTRIVRLEEKQPDPGADIVAVFDSAEAERVQAARGDNQRPLLCIITGVPRRTTAHVRSLAASKEGR